MSDTAVIEEPVVDEPTVAPQHTPDEKKKDRSKRRPKKQPPYAVIVHNDEQHTWAYVIEVLQRICGCSTNKAFVLTSQIHFGGRAAVWSGPKEVAELKRDQIRGYGPDDHAPKPVRFPLGVTIEPLPGE